MVGAEQRIGVGADPEERDVAEVEQAAPADDDVEPEREQHEDDRVEGDAADVAAVEARTGRGTTRPTKSVSQAHHGTVAQPLLERPEHAAAAARRSPCRATHSSRPTAGLVAPSAVDASHRPLERPRQLVVESVAHVTPS